MNNHQIEKDIKDLKKFGYVQELFRDMGGFSNFAVSFSIISILTGTTQLYGYGLQHGGPLQMTLGWWVVSIFTLSVAMAMAELASAYPTAGALYHWSTFLGGKTLGWFTACLNTLGQFAILAGIDFGLAQFLVGSLQEVLHIPNTALSLNLVYATLLFSHALFNHIGIRVVSWLNSFSAWYHIIVVFFILGALWMKGFAQPVSFLVHHHQTDGYPPFYSFLVGLLLAQWTLTGYDASAHVTEETVDPRRNAPWGIVLSVAISVIAGTILLSAITLSIPDLTQAIGFGDNALYEIFKLRLGSSLGTTLILLIAGAMWLCGLAGMTSASRMIYAFARDGGLPFSKVWARVSPSHRTPSNAIWGLGVFAMGLAVSVSVYSAVVSIATIALYLSYGLPIVARIYLRWKGTKGEKGPWSLGKFSTLNAIVAVLWILFISLVFVLPPNEKAGSVMLGCFIFLFILWFSVARKRFRGPKIGFTK